jgi:glycosyltransferase involved in cell wall biosynthesis
VKLLFVSQYVYRPEQPGSNRLYDFLQALARRGHEPHVVAGGVHYLIDKIDPELARRKIIRTRWEDVDVTLTYASADFRRGVLSRLRSYFTYVFYAIRACLSAPRPDTVMVSVQPMFVAPFAWLLARYRGVPFLLEVRDLWPDVAIELGLIRSRFLIGLGRWLESFIYKRAKHIFVIGPEMKNAIVAKGIPAEKIDVFPQGYKAPHTPVRDRETVRGELDVGDRFVVMFAGSFGLANNEVSFLVDVAAWLKDRDDIVFLMIGEGNQKQACVDRAEREGLNNLRFMPMVEKTEIPSLLGAADAAVMALPPGDLWKICLQNKIFDYMGAGVPVVAAVAGDQEQLIREAEGGIVVEPRDVEGFANAIVRLREDPALAERLGKNAAAHVREHLRREDITSDYIDLLERIV